ncbi:MAG TPA: VOC family protein [Thermoplasmata archaeon]
MPKAKLRGPLSDANCDEVFLWVRDFGRMKAFYHEVLGLPIMYENPHFADLNAGRLSIALHAERETHTAGNNWFMEFLVRDIDAVVAELARRGVSVGPVREEDFGRVTSFRDPEGNEIGLEEPRRSKR